MNHATSYVSAVSAKSNLNCVLIIAQAGLVGQAVAGRREIGAKAALFAQHRGIVRLEAIGYQTMLHRVRVCTPVITMDQNELRT